MYLWSNPGFLVICVITNVEMILKEFKDIGVLFTSESEMEHDIDRRIGAASAVM